MKTYKANISKLRLVKEKSDVSKVQLSRSTDVCDYVRQFYFDDIGIYESFFCVFLNRSNNTTGWVKISQGGTAGTVVDVKLICKYAIECLAESVIVVHNHPSGNINPSDADKKITAKLQTALKYFDVKLLDHLVLTEDSYLSFADEYLI